MTFSKPRSILFFLALGVIAVGGMRHILHRPAPAQIASVNAEPSITPTPTPTLTPTPTPVTDVKVFEENLTTILHEQDPRVAIATLQTSMEQNVNVLNACHEILHNLGQESYRKYADIGKALSFQDPLCTSGYIHGVMEAYFLSETNVLQKITHICSQYPDDRFTRWQCVHGIGHGLMYYTSNNLVKSAQSCDTFASSFDKGACYNGIFMENYNADTVLHPSKFLKPEDPFYPCRLLYRFHHDCYMNAPVYFLRENPHHYAEAITWCQQAGDVGESSCYYGVAAQTIRRNGDHPEKAFEVCAMVGDQYKERCIEGAVTMYMSHFASAQAGSELCALAPEHDRAMCTTLVQKNTGIFE